MSGSRLIFKHVCLFLHVLLSIGVLIYPFAFRWTGWAIGMFLSLFFAVITTWSIDILAKKTEYLYVQEELPKGCTIDHLQEVVRYWLGKKMYWLTVGVMFVTGMATMVQVIQFFEGIMNPFLVEVAGIESVFANPYFVTSIALYAVILPLCCLERFSHFAYLAGGSLLLTLAFIGCLFFEMAKVSKYNDDAALFSVDGFLALPIFSLSYFIQAYVPCILGDLQENNVKKIGRTFEVITRLAMFLGFAVLTVIGLCGSIIFGDSTKLFIIENFSSSVMNGFRVTASFQCLLMFPIIFYVTRRTFNTLLLCQLDAPSGGQRLVLSFLSVTLTLSLAVLVKRLQFLAAFGQVYIQFIVPGVLVLTPVPFLQPIQKSVASKIHQNIGNSEDVFDSSEKLLRRAVSSDEGNSKSKDLWTVWNNMEDDDSEARKLLLAEKVKTDLEWWEYTIASVLFVLSAGIYAGAGISCWRQIM